MSKLAKIAIAFLLFVSTEPAFTFAQSTNGTVPHPIISDPEFGSGKGPQIFIDGGHNNFHKVDGLYKPFAELLRHDGYLVSGFDQSFTEEALESVGILVVANALNARNLRDWSLPTPPAFTDEEVEAVLKWIEGGGSLFLIVDHMPFPGASSNLAHALGLEFSNGFAAPGFRGKGATSDTFQHGTGLVKSGLTTGRNESERVIKAVSFYGSAFRPPVHATPVIEFLDGSVSQEPEKAWTFDDDTPTRNIEAWCQIAVFEIGHGRVVVSGEAAMFSSRVLGVDNTPIGMNSPHAEQNGQLLLNLVHWLSRSLEIEEEPQKK
jgi:hypothetical protein